MTYKEYYLSKESIEAADPITREAYSVASKMYKKHWGREFNLKCLTEDNIPIVYAFNMAQSLKDCIIKSESHTEAIKKEAGGLWHVFWKKKKYEVEWVYQRNTILGILYFLCAFTDDVTDADLSCIEDKATYMAHVKNKTGKIYFDVFKNAVAEKKKQNGTYISTPKPEISQDTTKALFFFNKIFRDGLDMNKVSNGLETLLGKKSPDGSLLFSQQRHWYIVYLWFLEIGFIEKKRTAKDFREWAMAMFGKRGYSTENDFSEARKIFKTEFPSQWIPIVDHHEYTDIRDLLADAFSKEKRQEYVIKDRFIYW
jgi:hypothetical protein